MNKKKPNQFRQFLHYLLNLGRVTSEGSQNNVSINHNLFLPEVSPLLSVVSHLSEALVSQSWTKLRRLRTNDTDKPVEL